MARVKPVRSIAPELSISRLQMEARISMGTARRYWYGTQDGTPSGRPMTHVDLPTIVRVAAALKMDWRDLVEDRRGLRPAQA